MEHSSSTPTVAEPVEMMNFDQGIDRPVPVHWLPQPEAVADSAPAPVVAEQLPEDAPIRWVMPKTLYVLPAYDVADETVRQATITGIAPASTVPDRPQLVTVGYRSQLDAFTNALLRALSHGIKVDRFMIEPDRIALILHQDSPSFKTSVFAGLQLYVHQVAISPYKQAMWYKHPIMPNAWYTGLNVKATYTERYSLLAEFHGRVITIVHPGKATKNYYISAGDRGGFAEAIIAAPVPRLVTGSDQSPATQPTIASLYDPPGQVSEQ